MKWYAIDTNIILHNWEAPFILAEKGENKIVLSETVLKELDKFKIGYDDINFNSREFSRKLSEGNVIVKNKFIIIKVDDVEFYLVNSNSLEKVNDDKIISDYLEFSNNLTKEDELIMISNDILFRLKVLAKGYKAEYFRNDYFDDRVSFLIDKYIDKTMINRSEMSKNKLEEYLEEEIRDYISTIHITDVTGNKFYYYRVDKNTFLRFNNKENVRLYNLTAKNIEQKLLWKWLLNSKDDITVIDGIAGTSKTLSVLLASLKLIDLGKYDKITYLRKTVVAGDKLDEIGFLPGNEMQKIAGYLYPLKDNIELIIKKKNKKKQKWSKEEIEVAIDNFEKSYNINYEYMGHLRGRNLSGIIIIDECQNLSIDNLVTVLSRVTNGSKVFITGSIKQIDNPYLNKYNNALTFMLNQCGYFGNIQIQGMRLNKVERGKITEWIENATK